jgi:pantothenate kinase type III
LPGFRFLAEVYPNISTRLPRIDTTFSLPPPYPCRNTEESIAAGIYWSIVGSVRQFAELSGIETVFLAGGDSAVLHQSLKRYFPDERLFFNPELVLQGLCAVSVHNKR